MKVIPILRKYHYVTKVGIFLLAAALVSGMAGCDGYTPSEDIEILDWYDLNAVRNNLGGNHILMNNLDSTTAGYTELASPTANQGKGWQPIGGEFSLFVGSFNGQGHEIRGLFINLPDEYWVGLFSTVDEKGAIENIGVVNANVTGKYGVGSLTGFNGGTVSNSYSTGRVTGESTAGGLVGQSRGTVNDSYSVSSVTGSTSVGGLLGVNWGIVSKTFWDIETSGQATSAGGTGKNTTEMKDIATFSGAGWNIIEVGGPGARNPAYIWNIVNGLTYPFLSWQS